MRVTTSSRERQTQVYSVLFVKYVAPKAGDIEMKLTDKEKEVMSVLWKSESPMTITEIIEASPNRTWKDVSVYQMLKTLRSKKAVTIDHYRPTSGKSAAVHKPLITPAEYVVLQAFELNVDIGALNAAFANRKNSNPNAD